MFSVTAFQTKTQKVTASLFNLLTHFWIKQSRQDKNYIYNGKIRENNFQCLVHVMFVLNLMWKPLKTQVWGMSCFSVHIKKINGVTFWGGGEIPLVLIHGLAMHYSLVRIIQKKSISSKYSFILKRPHVCFRLTSLIPHMFSVKTENDVRPDEDRKRLEQNIMWSFVR